MRLLQGTPALAPTASASASAQRILVVDANPSQRRLLRRGLEHSALELAEAGGLVEGLAELALGPCALVLLQGGLEEISVVEGILEEHPSQPVLLCTPDVDHASIQALATRGVGLLAMPYSLNTLLESVRAHSPD